MDAKKILIVDDDPLLREMLSTRLKAEGYDVIQAGDGAEGLEKAKKEKPDLIILDVALPQMNGYEVCGTLKSEPEYSKIPVILFSAKEDIQLAEKVGADAYIIKPFGSKVLLKKVKELIE